MNNFEDFFIFKNMGSYFTIIVALFQVISISFYSINGIQSINAFVVDLVKDNPPKRSNIKLNEIKEEKSETNEHNTNNEINEEEMISNDIQEEEKKIKKRSNIIINNFSQNLEKNNNINKNNKYENYEVLVSRANNFGLSNNTRQKDNQLSQKFNFENLKKLSNNSQLFSSINQLNNPKNNNSNNKFDPYYHEFTDYELNSMELYDAIIKDKRTFCYFFKLQMKLKQDFYKTFCIYEPLFPFSIKIISYLFTLSLNLVFNALLYNEKQIYEGVKKTSKNIANIFLRSFYAFIIVECISFVINCLIKNANYLKSLVYRVKKESQLRIEAYQSIKNIKTNFGVFIFIAFICELLFWVYLTSYCYCYHGEQLELFLGFLVTQFFIEIFCIPFALSLTCFRFIGMKL
jgi:hypothetical protein